MKKLIAFLLALTMMVSMLPLSAIAEEETEPASAQTEDLPEQIPAPEAILPVDDTVEEPPVQKVIPETPEQNQQEPEEIPGEQSSEEQPVVVPGEQSSEEQPVEIPGEQSSEEQPVVVPGEQSSEEQPVVVLSPYASWTDEAILAEYTRLMDANAGDALDEFMAQLSEEQRAVLMATVAAMEAVVAYGTCGEDLTWELKGKGTLTISGKGAMSDYQDDVKAPWESYGYGIKAVVISSGVTTIGDYAFNGCSSLKEITIPDSVTIIGNNAFRGCASLKEITIPAAVTGIGNDAFADCTGLEKVSFDGSFAAFADVLSGLNAEVCSNSADGWTEVTIQNVGSNSSLTVACTQHTEAIDEAVAATCLEPGKTEGKHCSVCEEVIVQQEVIPALGHDYANGKCVRCEAADPDYDVISVVISAPDTKLTSGKYMQLSAQILPNNPANDKIVWSLGAGDTAYATLTNTGKLTAKKVTAPVTVTVTAKSVNGTAEPAQKQIDILPAVTKVTISNDETDTTGKTLIVDVNQVNDMTFSASCLPAGSDSTVTWKTSDVKALNSILTDNGDGTCTVSDLRLTKDAAVTITITATASNGKNSNVKLKLTAVPTGVEIGGLTYDTLRGGSKVMLKPVFSTFVTDKAVTWTVIGPAKTTISASGALSTPAVTDPTDITVTVTARNNPEVTCTKVITLLPAVTRAAIFLDDEEVTTVPMNLALTQQITFTAKTFPENAMQEGTWTISPVKGASINDGVVTVTQPGNYTVKFVAADGTKKSAAVKIAAVNPVTSITLTGAKPLISGGSAALKALVNTDATNKKIIWTSSDESVATVSSSGSVKAKTVYEVREVTITASAADGCGAEESVTLTVSPKANVLTVRDVNGLAVNEQNLLVDREAGQLDFTAWSLNVQQTNATWKSSNAKVATVENGRVKILGLGTATITVTNSKQTGKVKLNVRNLVRGVNMSIKDGSLIGGAVDGDRVILTTGKGKVTFLASVKNSDATIKTLKWRSSDLSVATVTSTGLVAAKAKVMVPTDVTISAEATDGSGKVAQVTVTVVPLPTGVTLTNSDGKLNLGDADLNGKTAEVSLAEQSFDLKAEAVPAGALLTFKWKSSDATVATVENGTVTLLNAGAVTLTAIAVEDATKNATLKLTVVPVMDEDFTMQEPTAWTEAKIKDQDSSHPEFTFDYDTENWTAVVTGYNGTADKVTVPKVVWRQVAREIEGRTEYRIEYFTVTVIGESAFQGSAISEVTLPNAIERIGVRAFANCSNMSSMQTYD